MKHWLTVLIGAWSLTSAAETATLPANSQQISGQYLEVRSCDVYTGACVANSEMGLSGREGMLAWGIDRGSWNGVPLDGLQVIAVLQADGTLGDLSCHPRQGRAVVFVDARANEAQRNALVRFAQAQASTLLNEIVAVRSVETEISLSACAGGSCARVRAGDAVEIHTRCIGGKDHLCGNEENFYPPLTSVRKPVAAVAELAAFRDPDLNVTWVSTGARSAYLATFTR